MVFSQQQLQPGEDSRIQVKVTRNGEALAGETVTLEVATIGRVAGEGGDLEELGGRVEEKILVTDQQGLAETTFTAGTWVEKATITAVHGSGSRASYTLQVASLEPAKAGQELLRLSLVCDPLAKVDIAREKGSTITVQLHRADGTPVAGKQVQVRIQSRTEWTGRIGGPKAPQPKVGVLGREGERQVAGPYELMTDDSGKGQIRE